jgi:hypothetical protein
VAERQCKRQRGNKYVHKEIKKRGRKVLFIFQMCLIRIPVRLKLTILVYFFVALGVLVVSVLAIGPKVRGFKPAEDDGFLRAIKIRSTICFEEEVVGPMS